MQPFKAMDLLALLLHCCFSLYATEVSTSIHASFDKSDGSYVVSVGGRPWLHSGALRLFVNGEWHSSQLPSPVLAQSRTSGIPRPSAPNATGKIIMQSGPSPPEAGTDRFGAFTKTTIHWIAVSSNGVNISFITSIRLYTDGETLVFEQGIPSGAQHTNYKNVTFADFDGHRATVEPLPFLHFPSFDISHPDSVFGTLGRAGFSTWQSTFCGGVWQPGAPSQGDLGLSSGPVVVYEGFENNGGNLALMISPATHFRSATMLYWEHDWVIGISGEVTDVPVGYSHETILVVGSGMTATVDNFGKKLRSAYKTNKVRDLVVDKVGYWTDNGAFYYGDAYPQHHDTIGHTNPDYNLTCCTKNKVLAAKSALDKDKVPIAYMQLDDWWYHGPHPVRNFSSGVKCVSKWELPSDTYPGGLQQLRMDYGTPFLLYAPYFCEENQWGQRLVPQGADAGVPPPEDSLAFYTELFQYAKDNGGFGYEVDFMSHLYLNIPEFRRTLDASTNWQRGMNDAGAAMRVPIQFCMMQPADLLNSVAFDYVTNGRASGDYAGDDNWNIGGPSLLFWAVGLRPSKDSFWSGDGQHRQPGFSQRNPGTNGELNALLATMSTGPVGPSDGAGQHNATRIMRTCAADGTILQPEKPITPIDAMYREVLCPQELGKKCRMERQLHAAAVWSTYSHGKGAVSPSQYHIIGIDVKPDAKSGGVAIFSSDLYPIPEKNVFFAVRDWYRSAPCIHGHDAVASGCIRVTNGSAVDPLVMLDNGMTWPFGTHTTQLYTATLLTADKYVLLGELDKFVPLSSKRFGNLAASKSLKATVWGKPGEVVYVTALQPHSSTWLVVTSEVQIGSDGTAQLNLGMSTERYV